jgi:hypothetical protein
VIDPNCPEFYVAFAIICLDQDSFEVGIDMVNARLHFLRHEAGLSSARGTLHAQLAHYDAAETDFAEADELDSKQSISSYAKDPADMQMNNPDKNLGTSERPSEGPSAKSVAQLPSCRAYFDPLASARNARLL